MNTRNTEHETPSSSSCVEGIIVDMDGLSQEGKILTWNLGSLSALISQQLYSVNERTLQRFANGSSSSNAVSKRKFSHDHGHEMRKSKPYHHFCCWSWSWLGIIVVFLVGVSSFVFIMGGAATTDLPQKMQHEEPEVNTESSFLRDWRNDMQQQMSLVRSKLNRQADEIIQLQQGLLQLQQQQQQTNNKVSVNAFFPPNQLFPDTDQRHSYSKKIKQNNERKDTSSWRATSTTTIRQQKVTKTEKLTKGGGVEVLVPPPPKRKGKEQKKIGWNRQLQPNENDLFDGGDDDDRAGRSQCAMKNNHPPPVVFPFSSNDFSVYNQQVAQMLPIFHQLSSSQTTSTTTTTLLSDFNSPQYKAACFLLLEDIDTNIDEKQTKQEFWVVIEKYVLVVFLFSTHQRVERFIHPAAATATSSTTFWTHCDIQGVTCDANNRTIKLNMNNRDLMGGTIPVELMHLHKLESIDLSGNDLIGSIPTQLGLLTNLRTLDVSKNLLTGTIPSELGYLRKLNSLILNWNRFRGSIPLEIAKCHLLKKLEVGSNLWLSGSIPSHLFETTTQLERLWLFNNSFTGRIPHTIGNLRTLKDLRLFSNRFTGPIPKELSFSTMIDLKLENNQLTGTLPAEIGNSHSLYWLQIYNNQLTGTLPDVFHNLTNLETMYAYNNSFTGTIPDSLWNAKSLAKLRLHQNELRGTVPETFCDNNNNNNKEQHSKKLIELKVDDSMWFVKEPKISSASCHPQGSDSTSSCYLRDINADNNIPCPTANIQSFLFDYRVHNPNYIKDLSSNEILTDPLHGTTNGPYISWPYTICRSPTGCYETEGYDNNEQQQDNDRYSFGTIFFGYSQATNTVVKSNNNNAQPICDAVPICGTTIGSNDPRRKILNYITQITVSDLGTFLDHPESSQYKALCWMLLDDNIFSSPPPPPPPPSANQDEIFVNNPISACAHGSILFRYVMAVFIHSTGYFDRTNSNNSNSNNHVYTQKQQYPQQHQQKYNFATMDTCDWPGIVCTTNNIVEEINFPNEDLRGTLITEIGYLKSLKRLDLSHNRLTGTIDVSIFGNSSRTIGIGPYLEVFNVENNALEGGSSTLLLETILAQPRLKEINLSNNLFGGTLPTEVSYSKNLVSFKVSNNLLHGSIPHALTKCTKLEVLDISQNNLEKTIISELGLLRRLRSIQLNENELTGSIPTHLFSSFPNALSSIMLQSNQLTGSIPTNVGSLTNLTLLMLNHNRLKGTIPKELSHLTKLQTLHLHQNQLTGTAPVITNKNYHHHLSTFSFISDCGFPDYALPGRLKCESCTMCCNSEDSCQRKMSSWKIPIWLVAMVVAFAVSTTITLCIYLFLRVFVKVAAPPVPQTGAYPFDDGSNNNHNSGEHDAGDHFKIYTPNSGYLLILSSNWKANIIYAFTITLQIVPLVVYLLASDFDKKNTDWQFSAKCTNNSIECKSLKFVSWIGWFMFSIVLLLFLGRDFVKSAQQVMHAIPMRHWRLGISGFVGLGLTTLFAITSVIYNVAFSVKNTDLIMNAVILLFVNDLNEKVYVICDAVMPDWTKGVNKEVEAMFYDRQAHQRRQSVQNDVTTLSRHDFLEVASNEYTVDSMSDAIKEDASIENTVICTVSFDNKFDEAVL